MLHVFHACSDIVKFLNAEVLQVFMPVLLIVLCHISGVFLSVITWSKCSKDAFNPCLVYANQPRNLS